MSPRTYEPVDLARANFKIHQLASLEKDHIENAFAGHVTAAIGRINDGKEATVYLCTGAADELLAAKVFKARHFRHFNTDHRYRNLDRQRDRRMAKAMKQRTRRGDEAFHRHWIDSEWQMLNRLYKGGVRVPTPIARSADGVLMSFIGGRQGAAPRLVDAALSPGQLQRCGELLRDDIRRMLSMDIVHGDLSAYNILWHREVPVIIDVPQAMQMSALPDAFSIMQRDLLNLERFFERGGAPLRMLELLYEA